MLLGVGVAGSRESAPHPWTKMFLVMRKWSHREISLAPFLAAGQMNFSTGQMNDE